MNNFFFLLLLFPMMANGSVTKIGFSIDIREQNTYIISNLSSESPLLNQDYYSNEPFSIALQTFDLVLAAATPILNTNFEAQISPNPILLNQTMLNIEVPISTNLFVDIYNMQGKVVNHFNASIPAGHYQKRLELPEIAGTYLVQLYTSSGAVQNFKLIKL